MYNYNDKRNGLVTFNWPNARSLAAALSGHVTEYMLDLSATGKLGDNVIAESREAMSADWFMTEIVEHYVTMRNISFRKGK